MVLGSGRTWPHDFLFLTGFFSDDSGAGVEVAEGVVGVTEAGAGVVKATSTEDGGVMTLSMWSNEVADASKRDGYISPGVDRKDSAGESSNLTVAVVVVVAADGLVAGADWLS